MLASRVASAETFAPYGRLLGAGDRVRLGRTAPVLVAIAGHRDGPRLVRTFVRYPSARRLLVSVGSTGMGCVVAGTADQPASPLAFHVPAGTGVLLNAGVWHAAPLTQGEGSVLEALEIPGVADHVDRCPVLVACGVEGLRILSPEESPPPGGGVTA